MTLIIYSIAILTGTLMVLLANVQKKRDGQYNLRSRVLLNVGVFVIVFSLAEKLPAFIGVIYQTLWPH